MTRLRKITTAAAVSALLVALVGCSTAAVAPASHSSGLPAAAASAANTIAAPVQKQSVQKQSGLKQSTQNQSAASDACAGTPAATKHIYVSITQQHLWACAGTELFLDLAVTTGASALTNVHNATPIGTMHITDKVRNTVLNGRDVNGSWHDAVSYWMPFSGGDGFHDASWQTFPLGSPLYTTQGSHGCVHVALASLATLFDWTPVGTAVTVRN